MKYLLCVGALLWLCACTSSEPSEAAEPAAYTEASLAGKSLRELRLLRNEIFARHGYIFQSEDLQQHFSQQAWGTNPGMRR